MDPGRCPEQVSSGDSEGVWWIMDFHRVGNLHNGAAVVDVDLPSATWGEPPFDQSLYHIALAGRDLKTVESRPGQGSVRVGVQPSQIVFVRPGEISHVFADDTAGAGQRVALKAMLIGQEFVTRTIGDLPLRGLRNLTDPVLATLLAAVAQLGADSDMLLVDHLSMAVLACLRGAMPSFVPRGKGRIERAIEYIRERLHQQISLEEIAAVAAMSPYHFSRTFRSVTGKTPLAYVIAERVSLAKGMLMRRHDMQLAEVALLSGFSSQSHFSTVFRSHTGASPSEYRRCFRC